MSKITFRADDDLVERVEALDASKSEVMREALRTYLDGQSPVVDLDLLDDLVAERVDRQLEDRREGRDGNGSDRDVNVNITVTTEDASDVAASRARPGGARSNSTTGPAPEAAGSEGRSPAGGSGERSCGRCGEVLSDDHVYCPNCGEKAVRRLFCECGDELRSDWSYCPGCGRRTPTADVLDG